MPGMDFLQAGASPAVARPSKRSRPAAGRRQKPLEQQVQNLTQQLQKVCQLVASHDHSLREIEAWSTRTWLLDQKSSLAKHLVQFMDAWKEKTQQGQPHPDGLARFTVGAALAKWVLEDDTRKVACRSFRTMHDKIKCS